MALSGLEIYKLLPKTNCKDCGFPTCLAFAMKLSQKQVELSACPHVSEEATAALAAASAPPIRLITVGTGDDKVEVGNETVMFRHEKTFYHPPGIFVRIKDTLPLAEVEETVSQVDGYSVERVGITLHFDGVAVENASGQADTFAACVEAVKGKTQRPLILMASDPAAMKAALDKLDGGNPLIYAATKDNWEAMAALAKEYKVPLVAHVPDGDLNALANLTEQISGAGVEDIVLDPGGRGFADSLTTLTQIRRLALQKNFRPLGYPVITFPSEGTDSELEEVMLAGEHVAKYAGFVVLDHFDPATAYILLTLRLNIYTDPQKPIQVSPGLYEINGPGPDSPLLTTTNFSLTYFSVAGEVDGSGVPSWLLICDSEGMSVLTAWAAGNFDAEIIAKTVKAFSVEGKVGHHKIVIPGAVAVISGELEEELPGWEIRVGPREAVDITPYLKNVWN
ncbi:MAG: acetyl-CoA decarbonylase/synthase complex subunit gamma [Chloroflexota bacterium]|nr:acetyl-CoA decarbonylase/synthase complex subunit gamma [Chloroflexota bacterium]